MGLHRRNTAFIRPHRGQAKRTPASSSHQLNRLRLWVMSSSWTPARIRSLHRSSPVRIAAGRSGATAIDCFTFRQPELLSMRARAYRPLARHWSPCKVDCRLQAGITGRRVGAFDLDMDHDGKAAGAAAGPGL